VSPNSPSFKNFKETEFNSVEDSDFDTITNQSKPNLSVVNEQTFVNDPKIKLTIEKDNTNSTTVQQPNLSLAELVEGNNQRLQANLERARTVANELLSLEKQDNNVNNNNVPSIGLRLLLPTQNVHSPYGSVNIVDSPQPSPRMMLLYELQESLGIGDAESLKYLKENRRSLPVMLSGRTHSNTLSSDEDEESQEKCDSRPSIRVQTQPNKAIRRRSSPNFSTIPFSPISNMSTGIAEHPTSSHVKKDLNSLPRAPNVEKRSLFTSSLVFLSSTFRD
jgi:hypothetical protein